MSTRSTRAKERSRAELAALVGVLVLALGLRFAGIQFGKPYRYHPDEVKLVIQAGVLLDHFPHLTRDAIFNIGTYPPFFTYVLAGLFGAYAGVGLLTGRYDSVAQAKLAYYTNPFQYHLLGRVVVALSGVATVWLVFLLARKLYGRRVAFASSLILAVLFLHVRNSHFATVDVPVTFLGFAAVAAALWFFEDGDIRKLWAGFALAGVAAATKYQAGVALVPIGLAALLRGETNLRSLPGRLIDWRLWAGGLIFVLVFLVACPMPLVDWHEFVGGLRGTANFESAGKVGTGGGFFSYILGGTSPGYGFFARNSMPDSMGWVFTVLAV
ncbi:MAG: phospholipid carrier-dependent glycosyltransferase, partial [Calditrichaeota bacterium]|nr:phospholipid carrier-dependent glycosyltransferase [Calditrichota bacterium]